MYVLDRDFSPDDGIEQGNNPADPNDDDPTRVQLGANPGTVNIASHVWRDDDLDKGYDPDEVLEENWEVALLFNNRVSVGDIVPYTINLKNQTRAPISAFTIKDIVPVGLAGVKIVTTSGKVIITDVFGRYHLTDTVLSSCRGKNFVLKIDTTTLPLGTAFTTANPKIVRLTSGVMQKVNFGVRF